MRPVTIDEDVGIHLCALLLFRFAVLDIYLTRRQQCNIARLMRQPPKFKFWGFCQNCDNKNDKTYSGVEALAINATAKAFTPPSIESNGFRNSHFTINRRWLLTRNVLFHHAASYIIGELLRR